MFAENDAAGGETTEYDYCVDMRIVDMNNGEEFLKLDVLVLIPESNYGLFVLNKPVAINKWMVLITPEFDDGGEGDFMSIEHKAYAFETTMDCTKIPAETAVVWLRKAMLKKKSKLIITSRPLICYLFNMFHADGEHFVPVERPSDDECTCTCHGL